MNIGRLFRRHGAILVGIVSLVLVVGTLTVTLFLRSSSALEQQLRETLKAAALSTALSIDGDILDDIHGPDDLRSPEYIALVNRLRELVDQLPQAKFAYILRRTQDPMVLEFVVDADAAAPFAVLDRNGNGLIDNDEEPSFPGEQYDISEIPALQHDAFILPTTDPDVTVDQWGSFLSGYAPIHSRSTNEVVGVVGVDMDAYQFKSAARSILSPFAVILIIALAGLCAGGVALLSELHRLQAISRINAERSGLLQLTFHQIGEPLTIIQWGIETLEEAQKSSEELRRVLPENLRDMREGVRRLGSMIDTLQEAEKVELNAFKNEPVEQHVKKFIEEAIEIMLPVTEEGRARVEIDAPDTACMFDPHLLTIVLRRLVENALDYSPADGAPVHIGARIENRKTLTIDITDHGIGIPAEEVPKLFEKYRRASNATSMKPDGNGLGLYISKGLVEMMGGTIAVRSREGHGTTFTIRIPARPKLF